ncbi:MAG: hypothetical protein E4H14_18175, partial [Candidatus Thorarchaeota archaeon]
MWRTIRPDSLSVWKDSEVVRRLPRYRAIIDNERLAKYLIAKKFAFDGDLSLSTSGLWNLHKDISSKFESFIPKVDTNYIDLSEVASPTQSFLDLKIE